METAEYFLAQIGMVVAWLFGLTAAAAGRGLNQLGLKRAESLNKETLIFDLTDSDRGAYLAGNCETYYMRKSLVCGSRHQLESIKNRK